MLHIWHKQGYYVCAGQSKLKGSRAEKARLPYVENYYLS